MSPQPEAKEIGRCQGGLVETGGVDDVLRKVGPVRRDRRH
jgi:hypothetical protein